MNFHDMWHATLGELELTLTKANFTTWFKNTFISSYENSRVVISVPNTFTKSWLEKKYHEAIVRALRNVTSNAVREVVYRVEARNTTPLPQFIDQLETTRFVCPEGPSLDASDALAQASESGLNPRYSFDSFVVGKANELAHAAAMAVATNPGANYNPLYIYGSSGLGKTHLIQAIGNHILNTAPKLKIFYVTTERFVNEFIQAVRGGRGKEFKDVYRGVDVLLVDDIQFLTGKESTQEEFFHTFNALHGSDRQIILTSDRSPKDIIGLETRLLTRFDWGMTTDVSMPDFETRIAILEAKARDKKVQLKPEIFHYIAGMIQSNIRELEGALNKISAYHQFKNTVPTLESVQLLLQSFVPDLPKRTITPRRLVEIVVSYYDLSIEELMSKSREQRLAFPRQIAMYLLREEAKCSYPAIGTHFGGRDHTTAMHACSKISNLVKKDEQLKRDIVLLRERLYAGTTTN